MTLVLELAVVPFAHAQEAAVVQRLKAAIVSKLPQFVEWPPATLDGRDAIAVCVAEASPLARDLATLVSGTTISGRRVVTRTVASASDLTGCHVLYLPAQGNSSDPLLRRAASLPILTIGDDPHFLDQGGVVALRLVDGKVKFDVDVAAAQRVGLQISSQVLSLAASVRGGPS